MIDGVEFPDDPQMKDGVWRPIFFHSNFDTPERLVAGVVSHVGGVWHLQIANALDRLKCLYGKESDIAIEAIEAGLQDLENTLRERNELPKHLAVSGLTFGEARNAQAIDAASLSQRWLRTISALHDHAREFSLEHSAAALLDEGDAASNRVSRAIERDRLSVLVFEDLVGRAPQTRGMFNPHVRKLSENESSRLLSHQAYVAYDGKKVAANFSTLKAGRHKVSVDIAKRLMWDLEQHREQHDSFLEKQSHEMFLHHPSKDDPQITERQYENVMEVVGMLVDEGKIRDIAVKPHDQVHEISESILASEEF